MGVDTMPVKKKRRLKSDMTKLSSNFNKKCMSVLVTFWKTIFMMPAKRSDLG